MPAELWLLAGPNGAGKSSFLDPRQPLSQLIGTPKPLLFNPDEQTRKYLHEHGHGTGAVSEEVEREAFLYSVRAIEQQAYEAVRGGSRICLETVLSTKKYLPLVDEVYRLGGQFHLIYIALNSPALSAARVAQRVLEGGHDVPSDRLQPRWQNSLQNLPVFAALATSFHVFDNSRSEPPEPTLIAYGRRASLGKLVCGEIRAPEAIPAVTEVLRPLF